MMSFSQMKVASENLPEIPDSTLSIYVSYHAVKFSTWKHPCLYISLINSESHPILSSWLREKTYSS